MVGMRTLVLPLVLREEGYLIEAAGDGQPRATQNQVDGRGGR
jgi:hypothetical protein